MMRKVLIAVFIAIAAILVGCNIFNPMESTRISNDDADALTYEGYLRFRNGEYSEATKYFNKAIKADSSHSEAWYGLAKSTLSESDANLFDLLKYVANTDDMVNLLVMSNRKANKLYDAISSTLDVLEQLVDRDTLGRTDKAVTFDDFYGSYAILEICRTALILRKASLNYEELFIVSDDPPDIFINAEMLEGTDIDLDALNKSMACLGNILESKPSITNTIVESFVDSEERDEETKEQLSESFITHLKEGFQTSTASSSSKKKSSSSSSESDDSDSSDSESGDSESSSSEDK